MLDALNQAICQRAPSEANKLIHHSDRGSQYLSIRYTERLAEARIDTSVGSVGSSYDNALAESIIGLFKTEVIKCLGPWKSVGQVEWETLRWVHWYNKTRLHSAIGYITPNEAEEAFYANLNVDEKAAPSLNHKLSGKPGAVRCATCVTVVQAIPTNKTVSSLAPSRHKRRRSNPRTLPCIDNPRTRHLLSDVEKRESYVRAPSSGRRCQGRGYC